jgi:hypothetical protein
MTIPATGAARSARAYRDRRRAVCVSVPAVAGASASSLRTRSLRCLVITEARPQPFTWPFRAPKRPYPLTCAYAPLRYSGAIVRCTSDVPPRASCYRVRIRHTLHA